MNSIRIQKQKIFTLGLLISAMALLLSACIAPVEEMPSDSTSAPAETSSQLTEDQLKNATYSGIYDEPVTLSDGMYEGEPFVEGGASRPTVTFIDGATLQGDLTGDGIDDAAVLLVENSGGSGVFNYIGAQINEGGQPVDAGTVMLGDRSQIISGMIANGQVLIDIVTQGPDEPMCCGTLKVRKSLALQDGMLADVGTEELGNVSLADLMGTSWVLEELDRDQPVLEETTITAAFADERISGSAGCNSYNAGVSSDGGQNLTVSSIAGTMMACPDPISTQETAYLTALQNAMQWSYFVGQLAITYQNEDGNVGTLIYAPAAPAEDAGATESAETPAASTDTSANDVISATFHCEDDATIEAVFDNTNNTVTLTMPDQSTIELPQAMSGSGARYSDGKTAFWNKGNTATLEVNGKMVYTECSTEQ